MDNSTNTHEHKEHAHTSHENHAPKEHKPAVVASKTTTGDKDKVHRYLLWAAVIQIVLLIYIASQIGGVSTLTGGTVVVDDQPTVNNPPPSAPVDMESLIDDDAIKGDPNAPVTIVEFSDFECPFCGRFYSQTLSEIDEKYIKTGKVKFVYRDFPLSFHPQAQKSAEAAECAGEQDKFYEMHDLLFENGVQGGVSAFKGFASEIGLDTAEFNECLDSGEMESEVKKDFLDGQKAGIQGTPGFIINGKLVSGAQPFSVFEQIIEAELSS